MDFTFDLNEMARLTQFFEECKAIKEVDIDRDKVYDLKAWESLLLEQVSLRGMSAQLRIYCMRRIREMAQESVSQARQKKLKVKHGPGNSKEAGEDLETLSKQGGILKEVSSLKKAERWMNDHRGSISVEVNMGVLEDNSGNAVYYVLPWNDNDVREAHPKTSHLVKFSKTQGWTIRGYVHRHPSTYYASENDRNFFMLCLNTGMPIDLFIVAPKMSGVVYHDDYDIFMEPPKMRNKDGKGYYVIDRLHFFKAPNFYK